MLKTVKKKKKKTSDRMSNVHTWYNLDVNIGNKTV